MNFDIEEIIRQKQQRQPKRIVIPNGDVVILPQFGEDESPSESSDDQGERRAGPPRLSSR